MKNKISKKIYIIDLIIILLFALIRGDLFYIMINPSHIGSFIGEFLVYYLIILVILVLIQKIINKIRKK